MHKKNLARPENFTGKSQVSGEFADNSAMAVNYCRLNEFLKQIGFVAAILVVGAGLGFFGSMFYYIVL